MKKRVITFFIGLIIIGFILMLIQISQFGSLTGFISIDSKEIDAQLLNPQNSGQEILTLFFSVLVFSVFALLIMLKIYKLFIDSRIVPKEEGRRFIKLDMKSK